MGGKLIRRQYFCLCEGQQEELYFARLSKLLKTNIRQVKFTTKQGLPGNIDRHCRGIQYDKAIVFDHDGNPEAFLKALNTCIKTKCAHAYSNRNFDLWLLLHKQSFTGYVSENSAYVNMIRSVFNLDSEADIKKEAVQKRLLEQISLTDVKKAICHAKRIRELKLPGDGKRLGTTTYYDNPDLSIHEFIEKVLSECGETI
ncbi:MAG: RloB family protein [Peptococcaceae bacterium]|nr:RloB family protein [Peptococcaceae bacterium]